MNVLLLNRSAGLGHPGDVRSELYNSQLHALQPSDARFERPGNSSQDDTLASQDGMNGINAPAIAHFGGVNAIEIDKFEGRYLLSGGADSTVSIWDLESPQINEDNDDEDVLQSTALTFGPLGTVPRSSGAHKFGITDVSWYPFDSLAFLTSSFDTTLKIYDSLSLKPTASFPLDSAVYAHSISPIASHLLVACCTQHPTVRLVDLKSGSNVQALAGHHGAVLTAGWSPKDDWIVATGGVDGTVRLWDIRRSASQLGVLDIEDSVGIMGYDGKGTGARHSTRGRAHIGPVNGVKWTADGRYLVSTGHDEKIRVWDMKTGANTLANFGPLLKNRALSRLIPCLPPSSLVDPGKDILYFPSEKEILMYEMFEGRLIKRLRIPGSGAPTATSQSAGGIKRVKDLAWRPYSLELYSAHTDGSIRVWRSWTDEDEHALDMGEDEDRKRKRQVLDEIHRDVTKRQRDEMQS
jgi:DNA excision repair protein ERCC-8